MIRIANFLKVRFLQGWPLVILIVVIGTTQLLRVTTFERDCGEYSVHIAGRFVSPFDDLCDPIISEEGQLIIIATTIVALAIYPKAND